MVPVLALEIQGWPRPMTVDQEASLVDRRVRDIFPRSLTFYYGGGVRASGRGLVSLDLRVLFSSWNQQVLQRTLAVLKGWSPVCEQQII